MEVIFSIIFTKTRSKHYQSVVNLMMGLPNYTCENECHSISIYNLTEFIQHRRTIDYILHTIIKWKTCEVSLYGHTLKHPYYTSILEHRVGKYWKLFQWNSDIDYEEELPFPFVHYPEFGIGSFIGFSKDIDSQIYFCECQRKSIENYIRLRDLPTSVRYCGPRSYPLGSESFPMSISEKSFSYVGSPTDLIKFKKDICCRCNNTVPHMSFSGNGSLFMKKYGWYVMEEYYKLGIDRLRRVVIPNYTDDTFYCSMRDYFEECNIHHEEVKRLISLNQQQEIVNLPQPSHPDTKIIENSVREQMGYKKIGDGWVSETIMYNILCKLYPDYTILRHYRPQWLDKLELDVYIPDLKIGFEYQGIQHFQSVEHWGGEDQLLVVQEHDIRKKRLCVENNVTLICINYDEPLTESHIKDRIQEVLSS